MRYFDFDYLKHVQSIIDVMSLVVGVYTTIFISALIYKYTQR